MTNTRFHHLAKDAGTRLENFLLTYAASAIGVYFLALTQTARQFTDTQAVLLLAGLVGANV